MKVQEWLRNNGGNLELLEEQLGIKATCHEDGRVILNYNQLTSPKTNEIVLECRGLTLDRNNNWELVARSFSRFFNLNEIQADFNWNNFSCQEKLDGSLVLLYYWQGQWRINTRGSFGQGEINYAGLTWDELIRPLFDESLLNQQYTYVCEFCSPYNKIVKLYPQPTLYLLTVFNQYDELEFNDYMVEAGRCSFLTPKVYTVLNKEEIDELIEYLSGLDKTNEGVVLRDGDNNRIKVKSSTYLSLHRMANNGDPCHPKNLLPFILAGELDELLSYFPEVKDRVAEMEAVIMLEYQHVDNYWYCFKDEPSQKKFALAIQDCRHKGILFSARKLGVDPKDLFYNIDYLVKMFKCKK